MLRVHPWLVSVSLDMEENVLQSFTNNSEAVLSILIDAGASAFYPNNLLHNESEFTSEPHLRFLSNKVLDKTPNFDPVLFKQNPQQRDFYNNIQETFFYSFC